jgi:hypothetical protein
MVVWEMSLRSTCTGVYEGLAAALCGSWRCRGAEEVLGVIRLLCSDTLRVRLCRLGPAPQVDLLESSSWRRRSAPGADMQA